MASGWNVCVCLECIGVVSGCCCKEVYRILIINITFPYSTCINSVHCLNVFSFFKTKNAK